MKKVSLLKIPAATKRYPGKMKYYFIIDGEKVFFSNLIPGIGDPFNYGMNERDGMAYLIRSFRNNGYRFWLIYGHHEDPLKMLKWIRGKGYTIETDKLINRCQDLGFADIIGHLKETSYAFMYRIYDNRLLMEIIRELRTIKRTKNT